MLIQVTQGQARFELFIQQTGINKYAAVLDLTGPYSDESTAVIHLVTAEHTQLDLDYISDVLGIL